LLDILLILVLLICVITDLKSRKIYNKIIFPSLLLAFLLNGIQFGWSGLLDSLIGFVVGFSILLIPYLMGGMGAGDVKLLAIVGAIKGSYFVFISAIYMALIGGLLALAIILFRKGILSRIKFMILSLCGIRYGMKPSVGIDKQTLQTSYPYGVAIAGGAVMAILLNGVVPI
jgi:prepilin peptidase CpaA